MNLGGGEERVLSVVHFLWLSVTEKTGHEDLVLGDLATAFQYIKEA